MCAEPGSGMARAYFKVWYSYVEMPRVECDDRPVPRTASGDR